MQYCNMMRGWGEQVTRLLQEDVSFAMRRCVVCHAKTCRLLQEGVSFAMRTIKKYKTLVLPGSQKKQKESRILQVKYSPQLNQNYGELICYS